MHIFLRFVVVKFNSLYVYYTCINWTVVQSTDYIVYFLQILFIFWCLEQTLKESDLPQPGTCGTTLHERRRRSIVSHRQKRIIGGYENSITQNPW